MVEVNVAKLLGLEIITAIIGVKRKMLRFFGRMSAVRCLAFFTVASEYHSAPLDERTRRER